MLINFAKTVVKSNKYFQFPRKPNIARKFNSPNLSFAWKIVHYHNVSRGMLLS